MIRANWAVEWLHGETVRILGLTLGHFLWEGMTLALVLFVAMAFCSRARTRYAFAVGTLAAMMLAPVLTFVLLLRASEKMPAPSTTSIAAQPNDLAAMAGRFLNAAAPESVSSTDWQAWCACIWIAGVLVLSLRTTGGWLLVKRLRRERTEPLSAEIVRKCRMFEQRLGVKRRIVYLQSRLMETPSAIGWLRPMVLLPISAITTLSIERLEAVIVHELAHIRRLDCVVNFFQIAAETLLFYHPAIWWVNRVIRDERENCCDDISVEICGNATEYARALTLLESARSTPSWALSATGGTLKTRVMRLLRPESTIANVSTGALALLGILCATGVLLGAAAFAQADAKSEAGGRNPKSHAEQAAMPPSAPVPVAPTVVAEVPPRAELPAPPAPEPLVLAQAEPPVAPSAAATRSNSGSYLEGLKAAGLTDLSIDDIVALKVQGVTPDYIKAIRESGFNPTTHDLIAMKVQGIAPEYVKEMRGTGLNPSLHDLIAMKVQGITPSYVAEMKGAGLGEIRLNELVAMKVQGVDPKYVQAIRATGLNPSLQDIIGLKVQRVTPDYIREMKSAGLGELNIHEIMGAKIQGITPEFVDKVRSHGFKNLTMHQLIALKNADVF